MKKFALYLVITLLLISFSSTNKPQQVVDMFEKNTPERLKIKKYDLTLFCNDVDFILENKSNGKYTKFLNQMKKENNDEFKQMYEEEIKKYTVEEAVEKLDLEHFKYFLFEFRDLPFIISKKLDTETLPPIKNSIEFYKINNLQNLWFNAFAFFKSYDTPERLEIIENNNLECQKLKYEENQERIKQNSLKLKAQQ